MPRHTIEASEKPILEIFCDKYLFRIPSYQRPYASTTEQTGELLDDILTASGDHGEVVEQSPYFLVRPDGAYHQWRRVPPGELSIAPVADERFGRATDWAGAW